MIPCLCFPHGASLISISFGLEERKRKIKHGPASCLDEEPGRLASEFPQPWRLIDNCSHAGWTQPACQPGPQWMLSLSGVKLTCTRRLISSSLAAAPLWTSDRWISNIDFFSSVLISTSLTLYFLPCGGHLLYFYCNSSSAVDPLRADLFPKDLHHADLPRP